MTQTTSSTPDNSSTAETSTDLAAQYDEAASQVARHAAELTRYAGELGRAAGEFSRRRLGVAAEATASRRLGRIPIVNVMPIVDGGRFPARASTGEAVPISAQVFREGHDAVNASAALYRPDGSLHTRVTMTPGGPGTDSWHASVIASHPGDWTFTVEGWDDPYATWLHDASIKVEAGVDVELMLTEGAILLSEAADDSDRAPADAEILRAAAAGLRDVSRPPGARLSSGTAQEVRDALARNPVRRLVTESPRYRLRVQRERALYGAWYEIFPRSIGAWRDDAGTWHSGTLRTATEDLPRIAEMGFDVAYLTPISPIGMTNRKGRNNSLTTEPGDPGSPYAIGSEDGGHDAIHPELGTFDDFDYFVAKARENGLEVALDLALQCSPDHPWVKDHPAWFTTRADGTIAYAENPPKKYQDIYPLNFDNDPEGIYQAVYDVVMTWVRHGVTLFRVDNPHTKPVEFWEWLIAKVNDTNPEVIFLAEAFTKPAMMRTLAKVGFQQSYTYFTWRTTKQELTDYLMELTTSSDVITGDKAGTADYMVPSFWPTTHDILTPQMTAGGKTAFAYRAVLAATMVPTWGIYTGYELSEHLPRPGYEEQIDNEKYEFKPRDFAGALERGESLQPLLARLNEIRREHPALQRLRGVTFHPTENDSIIAYSRRVPAEESPTGVEDVILTIVNVDATWARETMVNLDMTALGLRPGTSFVVDELLSRQTWFWGERNFVRLDAAQPAHILHIRKG